MTEPNDAVARIADGFWNDVRPATDTPDETVDRLTVVIAQALSRICPCCRKYVVRDLCKRLPSILRNADRITASLPRELQ